VDLNTTVDLDDPTVHARLDDADMRGFIAALPAQCRTAWDTGRSWEPPASWHTPKRVVIVGMGGSAIGADVVATLAAPLSKIPVHVVRGYTSPPVDAETLVIASSYSGETEETLEAFQGTLRQPGMRAAITSGGRLGRLGGDLGYTVYGYEFPGQPRAALGWGVFALLGFLQRLGVTPIADHAVDNAIAELERCATDWGLDVPTADNAAKQIALSLHGRVAVVIGPDVLEVAARRFAGELSENAKQWALVAPLPEMNHNLIVGLGLPAVAREALHVILLDSAALHPRNRLRVRLTADEMETAGIPHDELLIGGTEPLDAVMRACYLGDWVSLYLAMLNGVEPTATPPITRIKNALNGNK
jgi:glucose/mannose-6-phosphate isomerase